MAYIKYACLIFYGVLLHLNGYATRFSDTMLCNNGLLYARCRCMTGLYGMYGLHMAECFFQKG